MNRQLKSLFVAVKDNKVICFDTNLKAFVNQLSDIIPGSPEYMWFYRRFDKSNEITFEVKDGCFYYIQKLK